MKSRLAARVHISGAGYTILEVLIVMAVTGVIFMATILTFGGRQATTEFTQGVRDYESKIQNVANDVYSGFYPNGYQCTANPGTAPHIDAAPVPGRSGANIGCISLGKVIAAHATTSDVITIVGSANPRDNRP